MKTAANERPPIRDEAITLLLAGHERRPSLFPGPPTLLAQNPEIQERMHAELDAVLSGRLPTVEDLSHLPYTERVVRESLRLYPPAWIMPRIAIEDCEIHGYRIRKGASVLVSQWIVHRNPRFYADPLRFDPDRWTEQFARSLPHFAYFPFGAGPRICIGNSFALMEASLILAAMGQRFRLRPANSAPVEPLGSDYLAAERRRLAYTHPPALEAEMSLPQTHAQRRGAAELRRLLDAATRTRLFCIALGFGACRGIMLRNDQTEHYG